PAAARCHSSLRTSRFPDTAHACTAWNHVVQVLGNTPGIETAKTPGDGGLEPGTGVQLPVSGKFGGYAVWLNGATLQPSCVAPPLVRSASVTLPACPFFTSEVLRGGIDQTLASYVSMQLFPTFTESGGHLSVAAPAGTATARQTAA